MPLLWNYESGKLENVPESDVTTGVGSGRLSFRKGVRIPVAGPDGREGTIAAEDAGSAFQNGWRYLSGEEVRTKTEAGIAAAKAEAFDKPVAAFAAGALRGASLGLSDIALGAVDAEAAREIQQRSPIASTAGEIVGGIAGLAVPVSPVAGVAKLGAATTKAATGALAATSRAGKIAAELSGAAVGSAVEGAAMGAGILVSEAALGDADLTASQVASTLGISTVLGAGLGVVGKGVSQAWNKWKSSASNPAALMSEGYGKATAKAFGLSGEAEKDFLQVFERNNVDGRAEIAHYMANPDELYARGLAAVQKLEEAGKVGAKMTGDIRTAAVGPAAAEALPTKQVVKRAEERWFEPSVATVTEDAAKPALGATESFFEPATKEVQIFEPVARTKEWTETVKDVGSANKIGKALQKEADVIKGSENFKKGVGADIAQVGEDLTVKLEAAQTKGDVFTAVHEARMQLDGFSKNLRSDLGYEARNTMEKVNALRARIQDHLRDANAYGDLAKTFREADEVFSSYLTAKDNFAANFMAPKFVAGQGKKKVLSEGKVEGYFRSPEAANAAFKRETISELETAVAKMRDFAAKTGNDLGIDLGAISSEIEAVKRLRVAQLAISRSESFTGKSLSGLLGGALLGGAGSLVSDDIGVGTGAALGLAGMAAANPRMAVKYLAKLERLQNDFGQRTDAALTRLLSLHRKEVLPTVSTSAAIRRDAILEMTRALAPEDKQPKGHHDALESLAPYITDPSLIDDRMVQSNPHLDGIAPNTYAAMVNQSHAALAFMREKWPEKSSGDAIFATPGSLTPSERHTLEAYAIGAFSPGAMIAQLESGNIDPKTIEAVQVVHPKLFEEIKKRLVEKIPEATNISYRKKMSIGMAFGIPTTGGLANIGVIQQAIANQQQQQQQQSSSGPADFRQHAENQKTGSLQIATR